MTRRRRGPVSRFTCAPATRAGTESARSLAAAAARAGATIAAMLDDLDALTEKMSLLSTQLRLLRDENQHLRTQLAGANVELDALRARIAGAMQRIDRLLERLPGEAHEESPPANA
jgi:septal ring factor EnvC (AmiA/AmiB activator)